MSSSPQAVILEKDHFQFIEEMKNGQNNILVVVRTRPLNQKELMRSEYETIKILDERVVVLLDPGYEMNQDDVLRKNRNKEMQFAFDYALDKDVDQPIVYQNSAQFLIKGIYEGYNGTVFAYGATGAGKTYTMIGTPENVGIMERSMDDLFKIYEEQNLTKDIIVRVSYIEIYNEQIKDLLTARDKNLDLREDPSQGVVVNGITEIDVKNTSEILHLLKIGNKNRTIESTGANEVSSRSHAVLQVQLQIKDKAGGIHQEIQYSKLSLVDLAGSERASNTQNRGIRLIEGAKINQSLLVLGNCIQALSEANEKGIKNPFVQYRGSKLTRLLKDSLGGNCRTVMVANISAYMYSFEDTYNTLNYANRAKNIKTQVSRNYLNVDNHISNYTHLIDNLKRENQSLKVLLQNKSMSIPSQALDVISNLDEKSQENTKQIELLIAEHFKEELEQKRKIFKLDEKLQEGQFEQFKLLSDQRKIKEGSNECVKHKERIQDNQQLINTLQASKTDVEKKLSTLNLNRQSFLNMLNKEQLTQSDQNYLSSIFRQNILIIENAEIQYKEKKQEAISFHKQLQIQFLKDQVKLRDEIINDQKNILTKNQIVNRISYEPLVELDDIEAQVSPSHNEYSFHSVRQTAAAASNSPNSHIMSKDYDRKKNVQTEKIRLRSHSKNVVSINQSPQRSTERILQTAVRLPYIGNQNVTIGNSNMNINSSLHVNNTKNTNNNNNNSKSRSIQRYTTNQIDQTEPSLYGAIPSINQTHQQQLASQRTRNDHNNNNNHKLVTDHIYENYPYSRNHEYQSQKSMQRKIYSQKPFFERNSSKKKINYYDNFQKQRSISKNINQSLNEDGLVQEYQNNNQSQNAAQDGGSSMPPINKYYYKGDKTSFLTHLNTSNNNESKIIANHTESSSQNNQNDISSLPATHKRQSEEIQNRSFRSTSSSIFSNSTHLNNNNNNKQIITLNQNKQQQQLNKKPSQNHNKILNYLNNDLKIQNISKTEVSHQQPNNNINTNNNSIYLKQQNNQQFSSGQEINSGRRNHNEEVKSYAAQKNEDNSEQRAERLRQLNINIKYLKKADTEQQNTTKFIRENSQMNNNNRVGMKVEKPSIQENKKQQQHGMDQSKVAFPQQQFQTNVDSQGSRQKESSFDQRYGKRYSSKIMSAQRNDVLNKKKLPI